MPNLIRETRLVERPCHQLKPAVPGHLADGKRGVANAQPGMASLFDVGLRSAEAEDEEVAEALFRAFEIVRGVQGPEHVVPGDLAVKCVGKAFKSSVADSRIDVLLFH